MWWILIGLSICTEVHGYASGDVEQSCQTMSPLHDSGGGVPFAPQADTPPYTVHYEHGRKGEPITVILSSNTKTAFKGFMLEARPKGMVDEGLPVGKFIPLDRHTRLLSCSNVEGAAVSQRTNARKTEVRVNWTAQGEDQDITFRATFVQEYETFWERVDVNVTFPTPTPPTTTTLTQASTTSTAKLSTTASTAKPSTTRTTTVPSTTHATKANSIVEQAGTALMAFNIVFIAVKMELVNIFTTTLIDSPFSRDLIKVSKILGGLLCAAAEISTLVLFCVDSSLKVTLISLVCVAIAMTFIELVIVSLPIGPSHELKKICDTVVKVCSVICTIFTTAVVFLGVLETDACLKNREESWLLKEMIAYTVWIFLSLIWTFVFSIHINTILRRSKIGSSRYSNGETRKKKKLGAAKVIVTAVSVILIVGTMSFTTALIVGIFSEKLACA